MTVKRSIQVLKKHKKVNFQAEHGFHKPNSRLNRVQGFEILF